jgi:hypothetical protein
MTHQKETPRSFTWDCDGRYHHDIKCNYLHIVQSIFLFPTSILTDTVCCNVHHNCLECITNPISSQTKTNVFTGKSGNVVTGETGNFVQIRKKNHQKNVI